MKKQLVLLAAFFMALTGCQHSDICSENTPTTPHLVIKFLDFDDQDKTKAVNDFNAREINSPDFYFNNPVNDTVASIPLQTYEDFTDYELIINQQDEDEEGDGNGEDEPILEQNNDTIAFTYSPEAVYVNRACGYKTVFLEFDATREDENNNTNWIKSIEVQQPNDINDEQTTHLYIYH